eukprot:gene36263-44736_t
MNMNTITPPRWMALIALSGIGMLAFGLYLQHVVGLNPCPMCIVQRYALIGVVVVAAVGWRVRGWGLAVSALLLALVRTPKLAAVVPARDRDLWP